MKAPDFDYCKPLSLEGVFDVLEQLGDQAQLLAGGQSLMPTLNMRLSAPAMLVDLHGIAALSGIRVDGDALWIGALTTHHEIEASALVRQHAPLLSSAVTHIAHAAIRNVGTFGGSIALADPAAEYPACALCMNAIVVLASRAGQRRVRAADFFLDLYQTAMRPEEVLLGAEIPLMASTSRFAFGELARRHGDYAIVGLAAHARVEARVLHDVRLAYLGAASTPVLAKRAAAKLEGRVLDAETIAAVQAQLEHDLDAPADLTTSRAAKLHLARVLTGRVLAELVAERVAERAAAATDEDAR